MMLSDGVAAKQTGNGRVKSEDIEADESNIASMQTMAEGRNNKASWKPLKQKIEGFANTGPVAALQSNSMMGGQAVSS